MAAERFAATQDEERPWALLSGDDYAIRRYGRTWVFICVWHGVYWVMSMMRVYWLMKGDVWF